MREMTVYKTTKAEEGSCNGCYRKDLDYPIYNVKFRALSFRVCEDCRKELIEKLFINDLTFFNQDAVTLTIPASGTLPGNITPATKLSINFIAPNNGSASYGVTMPKVKLEIKKADPE
jgi:hypothetical protein